MKKFSISQIEEFTGVQKHTLRIWEKRYAIVQPQRSDGNLRHYSLNEVTLLLEVILLYLGGEKISRLVAMDESGRKEKVASLTSIAAIETRTSFQMIIAMYSADIDQFEKLLDDHTRHFGIHRTVDHILLPFLERIKLFGYDDQSSEVHFVVTVVRKKIIHAIEQLGPARMSNRSALLFLPLNEHYDLLLLYMAYLLKKSGIHVWYLGTNISVENLQSVLSVKHPTFLITYLAPRQRKNLDNYLHHLKNYIEDTPFLIALSDKSNECLGSGNRQWFHFRSLLEYV